MSDTWDSAPLAPAVAPQRSNAWDAAPLASGPSPQQRAVVSANDNGDDAARALSISKKINVPAPVVQSDLLGYTEHERTQSAKRASENPATAKYIQANPLAASASSDDWDAMEEVSATLRVLHPELMQSKATGGVLAGISEIGELLKTDAGTQKLTNALIGLPYHLGKGIYDFGASLIKMPHEAYEKGFGPEQVDEAVGLGLGIALGAAGRKGTIKTGRPEPTPPSGEYMSFDDFMHKMEGLKTREEIDAFIASKTPGPPGAMLQITKAEAGAEALSRAVEVAQESKTKQRSPELFAEFGNAHDAGSVHVDAAKIIELYQKEGKVPAEGDGLFGFVPDLAQKAQAAAATGGEVTIPVGSYIAHVDPAVHEGLKASVRLHNDGVTLEEAKEAQASIEAWHGTPHDFESFDLTKIGTGEGAQVYGHGLYFAENKAVSTAYAEKLAPVTVEGKPYEPKTNPLHALIELYHGTVVPDRASYISILEGDIADMEASNRPGDKQRLAFYKQKLAILKSDREIPNFDDNKGSLYKVSINADPTKFLDWDKPFSEQSQHVRDALANHEVIGDFKMKGDATGENFYRTLSDYIAEDAADKLQGHDRLDFGNKDDFADQLASQMLAEAGIPGIKYLDQGSRGLNTEGIKLIERDLEAAKAAGNTDKVTTLERELKQLQGTRNFVVFDDKLVKITEKNGNPVVQATAASAEQQKKVLYLNGLFKDAKSIGLTEPEFKRYSDLLEKADAYVLERAVRLNRSQIAQSVTAEWKRNEAAVRDEVTRELTETGAFAADKFFRDNKIDLEHPRAAEVADELAPLFGFETGQDLLRGLESIEIERAASKKGPQTQLRDAIKVETAARMEERYGRLAENIAKEARDIALADHSFDIMAEEVRILAELSGTKPPLTRDEMVARAKEWFEKTEVSDAANYEKLQRAVAKGGREAEKALLKGDYVEALQAKQRQMLAATFAKESLALQRLIDQTERKIDRFSSEQVIKSIDQAHLEQIREMLASVGVEQVHLPSTELAPLRDFVTAAEGQLAVAPWLFENPPKIADMTVAQFREFTDSLKSMEHVGRWATKLENAMGEADLQNVVFDAVNAFSRFPFIEQPANNPSIGQAIRSVGRKIIGIHLLVERALDYTDKFNPHGPITEWLDRPLRDANVKEIQLTESVVRDLKKLKEHAGPEINEEIPNNLIPDSGMKNGLMKMTRQNLRVLMLNMGNWSNMRKLVEGFGVQETDLRRFVDANAKPSDVAWVNGVWDIFGKLKPEADAVQVRDTGVPVDTIEGVPWEVRAGALKGGYYPMSYDPYNSDITGHIARPLFDRGYFSAATPHGYTKARTEYSGAIDLSGDFLSSKLQGMVHDIAFRLPVRNANKLIENQEFRTAMAQYWGKEVADLMPGWLRDIANSHNIDDNYAKGLTRVSALIRQNVVATLIAYNPGTFIKHGFTAAVMSAERVGLGKLLGASKELGLGGAMRNLLDTVWKKDRIPDEAFMDSFRDLLDQGERGENARQFILDSSAVMRNRQRQYNESIRGAVDAITNSGVAQTLSDWRQRQMQFGRMAVAFSDQMSAMPTWLAAYKKAYAEGEAHADAVFIADKEVSRAHGSSFIGDRPMVMRAANTPAGEFTRWFTQLMLFWNHQQNNQFQLAWDTASRFRGNPSGEPGANAASIAKRVAYIMGIIFIEEMAGPAKDEHGHGLLTQIALASVRYLGGGWAVARDLTNGLAHGYEPSTGMISTLYKGGMEVGKDLMRATGAKAGQSKDWIRNTMTAIGFATGVGGTQVGRTGQFVYDVARGKDQPRTFNDYRQGLRTGHSKGRKFK